MEPSYLAELTSVFLDEAEEQLLMLEQGILILEQEGESAETVQAMFRAIHTLKGSSAAMGFEEMKQLTHEMEHILDQVRNRHLRVTDEMILLLFEGLDDLRSLKGEYSAGSGFTDITPVLEKVKRFTEGEKKHLLHSREATPGLEWQMLNRELQLILQEAKERGYQALEVCIALDQACVMKSARAMIIMNQLRSFGEILHAHDPYQDFEEEKVDTTAELLVLLTTLEEQEKLESTLLSMLDVAQVRISHFILGNVDGSSAKALPLLEKTELDRTAVVPGEGRRNKQTIRVDVEQLEHLMNLVGELVIDQTRLSQVGHMLDQRYTSDETVDELGQISDHVSRVIGELQEHVMKARMLPIDQLFHRFPRMIRDLAQSLNKEVNLVVDGNETELDRTIIEEIGDPLIHLIRNAIDHGLETAEERESKGKSPQGRLRIAAAHEENQVVISVEDDGAGIDANKVREASILKGIISAEEANKLTVQESILLIFRPGFSTASAVSDVSGRGVGMDIVRNQIEKLNGIIDIETRLGLGTRFIIKLPLTLTIITGLLIKLNDRTFILPMNSVIEIVRMSQQSIQTIKGDPVVVIRDQVLPVVWLHDYFQIPRMEQADKQSPLIVIGNAEQRIALVVDELLGNQEVVVKPLGTYIGKIDCISGATILGNGRVALILEGAGITRRAIPSK